MFLRRRSDRSIKSDTEQEKGVTPSVGELSTSLRSRDWSSAHSVIDAMRHDPCQNSCTHDEDLPGNDAQATALTAAILSDAPIDIVSSIISLRPAEVHAQDCNGRLPIHLACINGASAGVINLLLEAYPLSALRSDEDGCLPLHLAVETCIASEGATSLDAIAVLVAAKPAAVFHLNEWDETPVDISADAEARAEEMNDMKVNMIARTVCLILRRTSVSHWRKQKEDAEKAST